MSNCHGDCMEDVCVTPGCGDYCFACGEPNCDGNCDASDDDEDATDLEERLERAFAREDSKR